MPKLSDEQKERRRRQILDAARRCVSRKGVPATSMDEIIAECGMSSGAVYLYFPGGKDALVAAAMRTSFEALAVELTPLLLRGVEMEASEFLSEAATLIEHFSRREGYDLRRVAIHGWSQALIDPALGEIQRAFYVHIVSRLRPLAERWPEWTAEALLAMLLGRVVATALMEAGPLPASRTAQS